MSLRLEDGVVRDPTTQALLDHVRFTLSPARLEAARASFALARPFQHVVLDDLFPSWALESVDAEFKDHSPHDCRVLGRSRGWHCTMQQHKNDTRIAGWLKLGTQWEINMGNVSRSLMHAFKSNEFRSHVESITQIPQLLGDAANNGAGLHQIFRDGSLQVHADNNHMYSDAERIVNLFLYLNDKWKSEWRGELELWDRNLSSCETRISPMRNRLVLFRSSDFSFHGHPAPLNCPHNRSRRSLAVYYYTRTKRPANEVNHTARRQGHGTLYRSPQCTSCEEQACSAGRIDV